MNGRRRGSFGRKAIRSRALAGLALLGGLAVAEAAVNLQLSEDRPPRVTLSADREPLNRVLERLAEAANFDLEIDGDLGNQVGSWRFQNRPLPAVLESITQGLGLTVFYADVGEIRGDIIEVHVYGSRPGGATPARGSARRAPAPATADSGGGDDGGARRAELDALAGSNDPGNLELLAGYMRGDPSADIRRRAIDLIAQAAGANAYEWLDGCLTDIDAAVRAHCVNAMGRLQTPEVSAAMSQMLYGESDRRVRLAVISTLARQTDEQAGSLLDAASKDPTLEVESEAAQALTRWQAARGGSEPGTETPAQ